MRNYGGVWLVHNKNELRIFSNIALAFDAVNAIGGYMEAYSSPILVLYRLQELVAQNPFWDIRNIRINDMGHLHNEMIINENYSAYANGAIRGGVPMGNYFQNNFPSTMGGVDRAPYCG